jgi:hypothetical protein
MKYLGRSNFNLVLGPRISATQKRNRWSVKYLSTREKDINLVQEKKTFATTLTAQGVLEPVCYERTSFLENNVPIEKKICFLSFDKDFGNCIVDGTNFDNLFIINQSMALLTVQAASDRQPSARAKPNLTLQAVSHSQQQYYRRSTPSRWSNRVAH